MYDNTVIYLIECKDTSVSNTYVGHTTNYGLRCIRHETEVKNSKRKLYTFIRDHGGWSNWCMRPLSIVTCKNKGDACLEELYWYHKICPTLNVYVPGINYYNKAIKSRKLYERRKEIIDRINRILV